MPPRRVEVDLTSVCVQRGAVQLPYRLRGVFEAGSVIARGADADDLALEFHPPRELSGLRPFFVAHGLRPNDRIALIFESDGLRLEAVKRERARAPERSPQRDRAAATKPPERTPTRPASLSAGARATRAADAARVARERLRAGTDPDLQEIPPGEPAAAAGATEPRPRAADRVAYPRGAGQPHQGSAQREQQASAAAPTSAREGPSGDPPRVTPRWEPLDVTAPREVDDREGSGREPAQEQARAQGRVVIREVRRRSEEASEAPRSPAPLAEADVPVQGEASTAAPSAGGTPARTRPPSETPAPPVQGRGIDLFGLRRRLGFGGRRARDDQDAWPTGERAASFGTGGWGDGDAGAEDEDLLAGGRFEPSEETAPRPWMVGGGARDREDEVTLVREGDEGAQEAGAATPPDALREDVPSGTTAVPTAVGPVDADRANASQASASQTSASQTRARGNATRKSAAGPPPAPGAPPAGAVPVRAPKTPAATRARGTAGRDEGTPKEDRTLIQAYLARPGVPAIVRTEVVAETLGLTLQRAEDALDRIAEDAERVTRIRRGAYMVRHKQEA